MSEKTEKVFAKGIYYKFPPEAAPDFIIAKMSVKVSDFVEFLEENENESGYVNLEVKESQDGKPYIELDAWKPKPTEKKK